MGNTWIKALMAAAFLLAAAGCSEEDPQGKPYFEFAGGGFIFNYRLATADYGFVVRVVREIPPGGKVIATYARAFRSDLSQDILPDRPPVVGSGYHRPKETE